MRIVGYVRVSTATQAKGESIGDQSREIRRWCKANGHRLIAIREDAGVSGANGLEDREGLPLALEDIRDGRADAVVMRDLSRLARSLTVQEAALAMFWRLGGQVHTVTSGEVLQDDADDPMRTAMRQMMGVFAELERRVIIKRLRDGRRSKAERGGFAYGSPAYGSRAVSGSLVPDDGERVTLARIRELHAGGRSLREMAATLTAEGHQPKRAETWHPESLRRILARL